VHPDLYFIALFYNLAKIRSHANKR
jgi:hypothetical protein